QSFRLRSTPVASTKENSGSGSGSLLNTNAAISPLLSGFAPGPLGSVSGSFAAVSAAGVVEGADVLPLSSGPRVTYTAPNPTSAAARPISPDLADVELNIFADSALSSNVWCRDLNLEPRSMDENSAGGPANKMWGGRFSMSPAQIMEEINASIEFDKVHAPQYIRGSKTQVSMLSAHDLMTFCNVHTVMPLPCS